MKKTVISLLLVSILAVFCVSAFAADGGGSDGFNAGVVISEVEGEQFTVTIPTSNDAILAQQQPTLTVPCPVEWTNPGVSLNGVPLTGVTVAGGQISFPVAKGGVYTIAKVAIVTPTIPSTPPATEEDDELPFTDVPKDAFYYDAVVWAFENAITSGTSETTFSPNGDCTRSQMITFLWNLAGKPEPAEVDCPFTDVDKDSFYYAALLWAYGEEVSAGTSETTFSPDMIVSRSQAVTFLYRYAGKPAVSAGSAFTDVTEDDYFYQAVIWALKKEITKGTGEATFSALANCTRSQLVTFLYRFAK